MGKTEYLTQDNFAETKQGPERKIKPVVDKGIRLEYIGRLSLKRVAGKYVFDPYGEIPEELGKELLKDKKHFRLAK